MHPKVSRAERRVVLRLQKLGYSSHMTTQRGHKLNPITDHVEGTRTDIEYSHPFTFWIYIDEETIHRKPRQERRDILINQALDRRGIRYKRYGYRYSSQKGITDKRRDEIVQDITDTLDSLGYTPTK